MSQMHSDADIVSAFKSDDRNAINRSIDFIYKNHFNMIKNLVLHNSGTASDADDLFQDLLVSFYRNIQNGTYQGKSSIKTYLYAIARNIWYRQIRKTSKVHFVDIEALTDEAHPMETIIDKEESSQIQLILRQLMSEISEGCREILTDFYYAKMSIEGIREKHNFSSKQVAKTKKYRCLKKLIDSFNSKRVQNTLS